jgi:hypothetical protein
MKQRENMLHNFSYETYLTLGSDAMEERIVFAATSVPRHLTK